MAKEVLAKRLEEAQSALHELVTGKKPVQIMREGRSVTFTPAQEQSLRVYIEELKSKMGYGGRTRARGFNV